MHDESRDANPFLPTKPEEEKPQSDQRYFAVPGEAQLTARAIAVGCLVGSVVACTNIYIGLKIGWTFGASIVSAVLGFSFFAIFNRRLSVLETNITQTAGSAAGGMASAAGLVAAIPAMELLGFNIPASTLVLWALSIAFLGVFFAVPLRRQMVEVDRLRFPTGTATCETILAMVSDAGESLAKARALLLAALFAGVFTFCYHFVPHLERPPLEDWLKIGVVSAAATWTFTAYFGPSLFGAGFLIGPRVVLSLMLGAIVAWGILGPIAQAQGWAPGAVMDFKTGPRGWLLWPGVALMVSEALTALALSWKTFVRAFTGTIGSQRDTSDDASNNGESIPPLWWMGGLAAGSALTTVIAHFAFGIPWYLSIIAIALSSILAIVATRSTGETDINPVGGMGKVTQLVYGGIAPGMMGTNLMCAAITGAGASQAADMMQDLKTGHLLGASPRKQFIAQLIGICAGVVFVIPVYRLITSAYEIGGDRLPAPAAFAWKAMAELLAKGWGALPPHAEKAVLIAACFGIAFPLLRKISSIKPYVPSGMAVGIAFIITGDYSLVMFYGLIAWLIWKAVNPEAVRKYDFAIASGLIAGEGLMGIVNAVMTIRGIGPLFPLN